MYVAVKHVTTKASAPSKAVPAPCGRSLKPSPSQRLRQLFRRRVFVCPYALFPMPCPAHLSSENPTSSDTFDSSEIVRIECRVEDRGEYSLDRNGHVSYHQPRIAIRLRPMHLRTAPSTLLCSRPHERGCR